MAASEDGLVPDRPMRKRFVPAPRKIVNPKILIAEERCRNLDSARRLEWLETNGLGGFASSTVCGLNTRRYHGLLVAATRPPVGRLVLLSKLEEAVVIGESRFDISTNQYTGAIYPAGFAHQVAFRLDPWPISTFKVGEMVIEKSVFMVHGQNTVVIEYAISSDGQRPEGASLEISPLVAFRDFHTLTRENTSLDPAIETEGHLTLIKPYPDQPTLRFIHDAQLEPTGYWYRNFEYSVERERGLDFHEDLFNPFRLQIALDGLERCGIIVTTETAYRSLEDLDGLRLSELKRRREIADTFPESETFARHLAVAADQFIVERGPEKTVIAGYHWFSAWGRDTMIALPGLTLSTGRREIAQSILLAFARVVDRGMLPNRFPDSGEAPEYNTVDATLWYFEAVRRLLAETGDFDFVRDNLYEVLVDIIDWHTRGTRYNIHADSDGLLYSGAPGVQLTWMDAKVGDWVVTPRMGKPVEIQALWFNALSFMTQLAGELGNRDASRRYSQLARKAKASFNEVFWNHSAECLYDVIDGASRDGSIRPNQILAVSLRHSMLTRTRSRQIVDVVQRHLLTPYGLRSLSNRDLAYRGVHTGSPLERDGAYHEGTVWPWLTGPFVTAYLNAYGRNRKTRAQVEQWLQPFEEHLSEAGLGQISEVFDGDPPFHPGGCIAQAWSVAELLRVLTDEKGLKPHGSRR
jgi:predicted glycogen debranching enzyme